MHAFIRLFHALPELFSRTIGHATGLLLTVEHAVIFMHDEVEGRLVT